MPEPTPSPQPVPAEAAPRPAPAPEPRQRWRAVFGRTVDAASLPHREVVEALEDALAASALPILRDTRRGGRARLTFGAPLPIGMVVDHEQFDLWLTELRPLPEVREAVSATFAPGYQLGDIYDVWLGAPALPASVVGAEYLVDVASTLSLEDLQLAVTHLLAAARLPRERTKGTGVVAYDLRPLIAGIHVGRTPAGGTLAGSTAAGTTPAATSTLRMEVRFDPTLGSGRPEEVVAALAAVANGSIEAVSTRRSRLILAKNA